MDSISISEPAKRAVHFFGGATLVLAANELNVSIFKPIWFGGAEILTPEEILPEAVITPVLVHIPTKEFQISIVPNRLQLSFTEPVSQRTQEICNKVAGGVLRKLPHTPFVALGMNFDFFVGTHSEDEFAKWNQTCFGSPVALKLSEQVSDHPRFGSYFSTGVEGMRLKLDIKPAHSIVAPPQILSVLRSSNEWMHFAFNFHKDLNQETACQDALNYVPKFAELAGRSQAIVESVL